MDIDETDVAESPVDTYNASTSNVVHYRNWSLGTTNGMPESGDRHNPPQDGPSAESGPAEVSNAISIVQRGNLKALETTLRKQWRMGQNIVLCWSADERGLLVIFVPHYFLGNYCAASDTDPDSGRNNEAFIRDLISGQRRKSRDELFTISDRLDVAPTFIKLGTALSEEPQVLEAVEQVIKRYGLSYVESRAVLLFDIVDFSLFTPFEQASQLNSLSYSLNSAYNKLLQQGIEINFARTTTGDGYYIWNRDLGPSANQDLFIFMLLVVTDNAVAQQASRGNTVPVIRTGYHIGGHYELYQAEGVNPSVFSYIVGDVTIELARMLDLAQGNQILVGDFHCEQAGWGSGTVKSITAVSASSFVTACNRALSAVRGIALAGGGVESMSCHLTESVEQDGQVRPRRFRVVDKHNLQRYVYNLQCQVDLGGRHLDLGLGEDSLPSRPSCTPHKPAEQQNAAPSTEELIDDLSTMLKKRNSKFIVED